MKFAVLADTHVGRAIPLSIAEYRRKAFCEAFRKAVDAIVAEGVDYVFLCGDLFERKTLRPSIVHFVVEELHRLALEHEERHGKRLKVVMIRGNHDGSPKSNTLEYVEHPLAEYIVVIGDEGRPVVYEDDRVYVVGLGYYDRVEQMYEKLVEPVLGVEDGRVRVLLLHTFLKGYHDVPPGASSISVERVGRSGVDFVFVGHHHERHEPLKVGNTYMLTPGSTEMYDFGERADKGFYMVELDGGEPRFRWVGIEPLHVMAKAVVSSPVPRSPRWFTEAISSEVRRFSEHLRRVGKAGYMKIQVDGQLSEGLPADVELLQVEREVEENPLLLHVDVDFAGLELPPLYVAGPMRHVKLEEFLKEFGDFASDVQDMYRRVMDELEEHASPRTGLLPESVRTRLVDEWLRLFRGRSFRGGGD